MVGASVQGCKNASSNSPPPLPGPRRPQRTHLALKVPTFWGRLMPSTCSALVPSSAPTPHENSLGCGSEPGAERLTTWFSKRNTAPRCSTAATFSRRAASTCVRNWFCASAESG